MNPKVESDITPDVARKLRTDAGLTQREFWGNVGSNQASGHWFEGNKRKRIPKPIRMLIFLRYVANIEFSLETPESAANVVRVGAEISAKVEAQRAAEAATEAARVAKEAQAKAKKFAVA